MIEMYYKKKEKRKKKAKKKLGKNFHSSTGFKPVTSTRSVQPFYQRSYEATTWSAFIFKLIFWNCLLSCLHSRNGHIMSFFTPTYSFSLNDINAYAFWTRLITSFVGVTVLFNLKERCLALNSYLNYTVKKCKTFLWPLSVNWLTILVFVGKVIS